MYMDNTICSFSIHWVGCARVSFDRQLTYLQLTTGHISRIENSENSFQKMPSQSPTALHLSGLPPPNPSGASHLTNHPTLSGSVFLFPQFPNTKCFCVTQNEFKCDRHRRHLCDNVRRRAYIEIYICIYNILYVCIHIQKIIQLPAESSDWSVRYFLRGRRESNSYKFPDILQDSDTKTDRNISLKVIARFGNNFTTCHFCSSI